MSHLDRRALGPALVDNLVQPLMPPGEQVNAQARWIEFTPKTDKLTVFPSGITHALPSDQPVDRLVDQITERAASHIAEANEEVTGIRRPVRIRGRLDRD